MSKTRLLKFIKGTAGVILAVFLSPAFADSGWLACPSPPGGTPVLVKLQDQQSPEFEGLNAQAFLDARFTYPSEIGCQFDFSQRPTVTSTGPYNVSGTNYLQINYHFSCTNPNGAPQEFDRVVAPKAITTCAASCEANKFLASADLVPIDSNGKAVPSDGSGQYCLNSCSVEVRGIGLIFSPSGNVPQKQVAGYYQTGASCSGGNESIPTKTDNGCTLIDGQQVCSIDGNDSCAKINGITTCTQDMLPKTPVKAALNPDGSARTNSTATPAAPDNGTKGTPAQPNLTYNYGGTTNYYYNSSTVQASKGGLDTDGDGNGDSKGDGTCGKFGMPACTNDPPSGNCGGAGQPSCGQCGGSGQQPCGPCGGEGEPKCNVKIDETGVDAIQKPDLYGKFTGEFDADSARQQITDAAQDSPAKNESGVGLAGMTGLIGLGDNNTCPDMSFSWKGYSYNAMTPAACDAFGQFRVIFGLIVWVGVIVVLITRALGVM